MEILVNIMNGQYSAEGRHVKRNPTKTDTGIKMGFMVCEVHHSVGEEAAQEIADALNFHMKHHPEKHS